MKISVILTTNRLNKYIFRYVKKIRNCLEWFPNERIFTDEFIILAKNRLRGCTHLLEPTLNSLNTQTFKDFELVISHRYPKDAQEIIKNYDYPIKLVKEKHSIWHDLGKQYQTVANNKNTGIINSSGELIWHIDDLIFFNDYALEEIWNLWKNEKYMTGKSVRCIKFNKNKYTDEKTNQLGPMKIELIKNGWRGEEKPLTLNKTSHPQIPMNMFWTCSATVSMEEILEINGHDEIYDGALAGIDMDTGNRLMKISKYKRVASDNYIYELDDPTPKPQIRNDIVMRAFFNQSQPIGPINIKANSWKPNHIQMKRYKRWHKKLIGELDSNWNQFMNVPLYNLKQFQ